MGIKGLTQVIAANAPSAIRDQTIKDYFGRKVAVDASMSIYQFLIAVRQGGDQLAAADGTVTSHIQGMLWRTVKLMEHGLKPVYVFDGKPPQLKRLELDRRSEKREKADADKEEAKEVGTAIDINKANKRLVKADKQHFDDCKKLLTLMGVPWIVAPTEAEAQCAAMAKAGIVYGTASEDMDSLTFATPILLRNVTASEARKLPVREFNLDRVLAGLDFTMDQFIDLCILLGCDYCETIRGIGPLKAVQFMSQYGSIEKILENIDTKKYIVPEGWLYKEARELFRNPDVDVGESSDSASIAWKEPDEDGLVEFLTGKGFQEDRVRNACRRIRVTKKKGTQVRLESFFGAPTLIPSKRKLEKEKEAAKARKMGKSARGRGRGKGKR